MLSHLERLLPLVLLSIVLVPGVFSSSSSNIIAKQLNTTGTRRVFIRYKDGDHDECFRTLNHKTRLANASSRTQVKFDFPELSSFVLELETPEEFQSLHEDHNILEVVEDAPRWPMHILESLKPYRPNKDKESHQLRRHLQQQQSPPQEIPYGVEMVKAPEAWHYGIRGAGVKVCVVDSGTDLHEDLNQASLSGDDNSPSGWFQDDIGHGTHIAGTIAAVDNDIGVVGVAPDAEIFTVKFFSDDNGFSFVSGLVDAAFQCRDAGAKIISMSLGGPLWNPFEFRVFGRLLEEEGIISFAAAGNSAGTWLVYPASYNGVRSVAAVDKDMNHAEFSQSNHRVDLAAPGVDVLSLLPKGDCTICEATGATNGYGITSGTSMATPHAAGVAALLWSFKPEATAEEILTAMELSATDLGSPGHDTKYGHGLVNAIEALKILNGGPLSEGPSVSMEISEELANPILAVEEDEDEELEPISESSSPPTPIFTPSTLEQTNATSIAMAASQTEFDEEKSSNACSTGHVSFDLTLQTDAYGSEVSWELFNGRDGRKVLSVETDTLRDNRLYQKQICVPDDCYVFSIYDSQNDGICCLYGSGYYNISWNGNPVAAGGDFVSEESVHLGVCASTNESETMEEGGDSSGSDIQEEEVAPTFPASPVEAAEETTPEEEGEEQTSLETASSTCVNVALKLTTDGYPQETRFQLVDLLSTSFFHQRIWSERVFLANREYQYSTCVDPARCYAFYISDSFGDGLCCRFGYGGFELTFDGEVVASYTSFGDQVSIQLGDGCDNM